MVEPERSSLAGLIEFDETAIVFRTEDDRVAGGAGRSSQGKMPVIAAVEIVGDGPGRVRLAPIADYSAESIGGFVATNVPSGATLKTDGWAVYSGTSAVNHDPHVVGKIATHLVLPWTHRVFANLKRWAYGLCRNHLQSYLNEFTFRFNYRRTRYAAFCSLFKIGTRTKPVPYKMLISSEAAG